MTHSGPFPCPLETQDANKDDLRDATEKMIVAQAQRDRLRQRLQALDPAAAAEADAIAEGSSSGGDVVREQLERIAELEREVKRLQQLSRCVVAPCSSRLGCKDFYSGRYGWPSDAFKVGALHCS